MADSDPKFSGMEYRVVGPLGTGAGSTILQIADRTRGGKRFALKVVKRQDADDDIYITQALTEFEAAQKLNHPNIARVYDCRTKKSLFFKVVSVELLVEMVDGKTLDELETPTMPQLVLIFAQVADALVHMHRRGVLHADLKPSNIMVTTEGRVKLIDFGTAWLKGEEKNRIQGTPQYIAPETVTEKTVTEKSDVYNFGATMYRMFTGRYANVNGPRIGTNAKIKITPPSEINPSIPSQLNEIILACLLMNPARRPEGMHAVAQRLHEVAQSLGLSEADLPRIEDEMG